MNFDVCSINTYPISLQAKLIQNFEDYFEKKSKQEMTISNLTQKLGGLINKNETFNVQKISKLENYKNGRIIILVFDFAINFIEGIFLRL